MQLTPERRAELTRQLTEAREAEHKLRLGQSVQSVTHDGRTVTLKVAQLGDVAAYVRSLEMQLNGGRAPGRARSVQLIG